MKRVLGGFISFSGVYLIVTTKLMHPDTSEMRLLLDYPLTWLFALVFMITGSIILGRA
jgi:hypothetical protein